MASEKQIRANRRNAAGSTGPKTLAGKQAVRRNAVTHGLSATTPSVVVLPGEDEAAFAELRALVRTELQPAGARQAELVDRIAEITWRLQRVERLEAAYRVTEPDDPELWRIRVVRARGQAYHQGFFRLATEEQRARGLPPNRWLARYAQGPRRVEEWQRLHTWPGPWPSSLAGAVVGDDPGPVLLLRYEATLLHQLAQCLRLLKELQAGGGPGAAALGGHRARTPPTPGPA